MHHADLDFDATTGARFHTIEIMLSMLIKLAAIAALGLPAIAVLVFEVLLNAISMFNHPNVRMPLTLDRLASVGWGELANPNINNRAAIRGNDGESSPNLLDRLEIRGPPLKYHARLNATNAVGGSGISNCGRGVM